MVGNAQKIIQWLFTQNDNNKQYEIKEYKQKRSLSQNAYAWELIGKIADAMCLSKEEVYENMLHDYGQSELISVRSDINISGYFKHYKQHGTGKVNGKEFIHYKVYKGSSEMNSAEMSIFIEGVINEARSLGIDTMTPSEVALLRLN